MVDQLRQVIGALDSFTEQTIRELTLEATANLIEDTPVDIGWARNNWIPSIGVSREENLTKIKPNAALASAARATQQQGITEVALRYRLMLGAVFITNNVPYILPLNDGSSTQAPKGFVQIAIRKAIAKVNPRSR